MGGMQSNSEIKKSSDMRTFDQLPYDVITLIANELDIYSIDNFSKVNKISRESVKEKTIEIEDKLIVYDGLTISIFFQKLKTRELLTKEIKINDEFSLSLKDNFLVLLIKSGETSKTENIMKINYKIDITFEFLNIYLSKDDRLSKKGSLFYYLEIIYKNIYARVWINSDKTVKKRYTILYITFDSDITCLYLHNPWNLISGENFYQIDRSNGVITESSKNLSKTLIKEDRKYKNFKFYLNRDEKTLTYCYIGKHKSFYDFKQNLPIFFNIESTVYLMLKKKFNRIDWSEVEKVDKYDKNRLKSEQEIGNEMLDIMIKIIQEKIDLPTIRKYRIKN